MSRDLMGIRRIVKELVLYPGYLRDFFSFRKKNDGRFKLSFRERQIVLSDKTNSTPFDRHYIYHPAWAARILANTKPKSHVDISSTLHFSTIISAFIPTCFYDYRPANLNLSGLRSEKCDLLSLPFENNSIESLSCMHALEHIGLGRYGDQIDPQGDLKAFAEIKRVMIAGGNLLIVVPVGKPKLIFNANRIYSFDQVISYFSNFELKEFSLIPDNEKNGGLIVNAPKQLADSQEEGCGCFWFKKPKLNRINMTSSEIRY